METRIPRSTSAARSSSGEQEPPSAEGAGASRASSTAASLVLEERGRPVAGRTSSGRSRVPGIRSPLPSPSPSGGFSLAQHIGTRIMDDLLRASAWTPLTKVEAHVIDEGYCEEPLLRALKIAVQSAKFSFSIRHPGGPDTMECHQARAPAKGHDIDAKTAKHKTMVEAYGAEEGPRRLQMLRDVGRRVGGATLAGRVGVWSEDRKQLLGFYLVDKVNQWEHSNNQAKQAIFNVSRPVPYSEAQQAWRKERGETLYRYVPIDFDRLEDSLTPLFALPDWSTKVFGGDLDIHDLRYPQKSFVGEGSPDEDRLYQILHTAVGAVYPYRAPRTGQSDMLLFPHGPQQNYAAYAMAHERGKEAVLALTQVDLPVCAWVYDAPSTSARVLHFADTEEDRQRYETHFPPKKNTSHYVARDGGGLKLVRSNSSQDLRSAPSGPGSPRASLASRGRARTLGSTSRPAVDVPVPAQSPAIPGDEGESSSGPILWRSPFWDPSSPPRTASRRTDIVGPLGEASPMLHAWERLPESAAMGRTGNRPVSTVPETAEQPATPRESPDSMLAAGASAAASPPSLLSANAPSAQGGQGRRRSSLLVLRHFAARIFQRSPELPGSPEVPGSPQQAPVAEQAQAPQQAQASALSLPAAAAGSAQAEVLSRRARVQRRAAAAYTAFVNRARRRRTGGAS